MRWQCFVFELSEARSKKSGLYTCSIIGIHCSVTSAVKIEGSWSEEASGKVGPLVGSPLSEKVGCVTALCLKVVVESKCWSVCCQITCQHCGCVHSISTMRSTKRRSMTCSCRSTRRHHWRPPQAWPSSTGARMPSSASASLLSWSWPPTTSWQVSADQRTVCVRNWGICV